jgi:Family of unknown function (DUF6314)
VDPYELIGRWRLERRLVDRRAAKRGRVSGQLVVEPVDGGLRWLETGELAWDDLRLDVTREYGLRDDLGDWWMTFADGRPFHPWTPGEYVTHPCVDDVYRGLVDTAPSRIRTLWDVSGPAKSQRIFTRLLRDQSGP